MAVHSTPPRCCPRCQPTPGILLSLIGAVVGEFVSSTVGLGYLIANYNTQLKTAAAFAALAMLAALGVASYGVVILARRRVLFWLGRT